MANPTMSTNAAAMRTERRFMAGFIDGPTASATLPHRRTDGPTDRTTPTAPDRPDPGEALDRPYPLLALKCEQVQDQPIRPRHPRRQRAEEREPRIDVGPRAHPG